MGIMDVFIHCRECSSAGAMRPDAAPTGPRVELGAIGSMIRPVNTLTMT